MGNSIGNCKNYDATMSSSSKASSHSKSQLPERAKDMLKRCVNDKTINGWFYLSSNEIDDRVMPELCRKIIKVKDKVKVIDLRDSAITSQGAIILFDALRTSNSRIQKVLLNRNRQINDACMQSLGEYIKSNASIEVVSIADSQISDAGIEVFAPYLQGNTTLVYLDFYGNKGITDKSIPLLINAIETTHIESLEIRNTSMVNINKFEIPLACNAIKNRPKRFTIVQMGIDDNDLMKMYELMRKYGIERLEELKIGRNKITSKGASILFDTLRECKSIVSSLNISINIMDEDCMEHLGLFIQESQTLDSLVLSYCNLSDEAIDILSQFLIGNVVLREMVLAGNLKITNRSIPILLEIARCSRITKIDVWGTSISTDKFKDVVESLRISVDEREIPIKSNSKSAAKILSSLSPNDQHDDDDYQQKPLAAL